MTLVVDAAAMNVRVGSVFSRLFRFADGDKFREMTVICEHVTRYLGGTYIKRAHWQ